MMYDILTHLEGGRAQYLFDFDYYSRVNLLNGRTKYDQWKHFLRTKNPRHRFKKKNSQSSDHEMNISKYKDCKLKDFDCDYYFHHNSDIQSHVSNNAWKCGDRNDNIIYHFCNYGQFEIRPYRFIISKCEPDPCVSFIESSECNSDLSEPDIPCSKPEPKPKPKPDIPCLKPEPEPDHVGCININQILTEINEIKEDLSSQLANRGLEENLNKKSIESIKKKLNTHREQLKSLCSISAENKSVIAFLDQKMEEISNELTDISSTVSITNNVNLDISLIKNKISSLETKVNQYKLQIDTVVNEMKASQVSDTSNYSYTGQLLIKSKLSEDNVCAQYFIMSDYVSVWLTYNDSIKLSSLCGKLDIIDLPLDIDYSSICGQITIYNKDSCQIYIGIIFGDTCPKTNGNIIRYMLSNRPVPTLYVNFDSIYQIQLCFMKK